MSDGPSLEVYRSIGPFDAETLPKGLLREHRLKPGSWGRLTLLSGAVDFVWDEGDCQRVELVAGDMFMVPPQAPHHLDPCGPFELTIDFMREV